MHGRDLRNSFYLYLRSVDMTFTQDNLPAPPPLKGPYPANSPLCERLSPPLTSSPKPNPSCSTSYTSPGFPLSPISLPSPARSLGISPLVPAYPTSSPASSFDTCTSSCCHISLGSDISSSPVLGASSQPDSSPLPAGPSQPTSSTTTSGPYWTRSTPFSPDSPIKGYGFAAPFRLPHRDVFWADTSYLPTHAALAKVCSGIFFHKFCCQIVSIISSRISLFTITFKLQFWVP